MTNILKKSLSAATKSMAPPVVVDEEGKELGHLVPEDSNWNNVNPLGDIKDQLKDIVQEAVKPVTSRIDEVVTRVEAIEDGVKKNTKSLKDRAKGVGQFLKGKRTLGLNLGSLAFVGAVAGSPELRALIPNGWEWVLVAVTNIVNIFMRFKTTGPQTFLRKKGKADADNQSNGD